MYLYLHNSSNLYFQIDDTDAMEDVHSLLTDVPPPSGEWKKLYF